MIIIIKENKKLYQVIFLITENKLELNYGVVKFYRNF